MSRPSSGTLLVVGVVLFGLVTVGLTWNRYRQENPSSVSAQFARDGAGSWRAVATFDPGQAERLREGTRVIATSPEFPGHRMTGTIREVEAPGVIVVTFSQGPPADTALTEAVGRVTVDSATAPQ